MTPIAFSTLYDQLLPYLPAVELPLLDSQIIKVARDFFKRTTVMRESFAFDTVGGTADYQLNPAYGEVASILEVRAPGAVYPLSVITESTQRAWTNGQPRGWYALLPNMPTIVPTPDDVYSLELAAVIRPKITDTTLPQEVVDQYREELCAGVLAAMFGMPGKPWTQTQSAKEAGRMYAGAVKTVRATIRDGGQPNQSTFTAGRRFGR